MGGPVPHARSRSREHLGEGGWLEGRAGACAVHEDEPPSRGGRSRQERRACVMNLISAHTLSSGGGFSSPDFCLLVPLPVCVATTNGAGRGAQEAPPALPGAAVPLGRWRLFLGTPPPTPSPPCPSGPAPRPHPAANTPAVRSNLRPRCETSLSPPAALFSVLTVPLPPPRGPLLSELLRDLPVGHPQPLLAPAGLLRDDGQILLPPVTSPGPASHGCLSPEGAKPQCAPCSRPCSRTFH